jgi:hypothetical protein
VASVLLRSRLARCDEAGMPAYLESSKPGNVPLYEHFGFEVTEVLDPPKVRRRSPPCGAARLADRPSLGDPDPQEKRPDGGQPNLLRH